MKYTRILDSQNLEKLKGSFINDPDRVFFVDSIEGTKEVAEIIMEYLKPGMLVGLSGQLGAGKTEFVRCLLEKLGFFEGVSSPSFVLENIYNIDEKMAKNKAILQVSHWDLYRLKQQEIPAEILENLNLNNTLTLVEWHEKIPGLRDLLSMELMLAIPEDNFKKDKSDNQRLIGLKVY